MVRNLQPGEGPISGASLEGFSEELKKIKKKIKMASQENNKEKIDELLSGRKRLISSTRDSFLDEEAGPASTQAAPALQDPR